MRIMNALECADGGTTAPHRDLSASGSTLDCTEQPGTTADPSEEAGLPSCGATRRPLPTSYQAAASSSTPTRGKGPAVARTMLGANGVVVPASGGPGASWLPRRRGRCATNAMLLGPVELAAHKRTLPSQPQLTISPTVALAPATAPREDGPRTCQSEAQHLQCRAPASAFHRALSGMGPALLQSAERHPE